MKVVRDKSVWAALLPILTSATGRMTIRHVSLTSLEVEELQEHFGVEFALETNGLRDMSLSTWEIEGTIPVRTEEQDKYSRARRVIKGDGRNNTR